MHPIELTSRLDTGDGHGTGPENSVSVTFEVASLPIQPQT